MSKEINLVVTKHSYLEHLTEFNKEMLIKDFAKVVQTKWTKEALQCPVRKKLYTAYIKEVGCIAKAEGHTIESRKELLILWIERAKKKHPEVFDVIGWWDLKVAVGEAVE